MGVELDEGVEIEEYDSEVEGMTMAEYGVYAEAREVYRRVLSSSMAHFMVEPDTVARHEKTARAQAEKAYRAYLVRFLPKA